ncbi:hypothetical protein KAU88_02355 [Candidatus Bathyarchaeota archaeon]|nr:hypothetical protein [Candidatus Bathyarchaeota archaeon]
MIMVEMSEKLKKDKAFMDWFASIKSKSYQKSAKTSMRRFLEFLNETYPQKNLKSASDILRLRKEQDKLEDEKEKNFFADILSDFVEWQVKKFNLSMNSALIATNPIRGFFSYSRYPLKVRKGSLPQKRIVEGDHKFTIEQLRRMLRYGNARERAILLSGKDLGLRVSDFIRLKRSLVLPQLERAKQEGKELDYPLEFEIECLKEHTRAKCHITHETTEALLTYWESTPRSEYWFPSERGYGHETEAQINYTLRKLWSQAYNDPKVFDPPLGIGEKTSGRLRFHGLRDFFISALANSGLNAWSIKLMVGKKVSEDMISYLNGLDLKEQYRSAESRLVLGALTNSNHASLEAMQEEMNDMKRGMQVIADVIIEQMKEQGLVMTESTRRKLKRLGVEVEEPRKKRGLRNIMRVKGKDQ